MNAVLMNDDEYARMVNAERKKREKNGEEVVGSPSIAIWSPTVNLLAVIADRLAALIESNSANPRKVVPYARPRTAFDRLEIQEMRAIHERLTAALIAPA